MLYPAPGIPVPSPSAAPVLVFFHGNGENLETLRLSGSLAAFAELGFPYLAVEYPGYGRSDGEASESALVGSGVVAVNWMKAQYPGRPLIVAGWSLGAAVAVQTAARVEIDGLVAMSAWTSLAEIGRTHFPRWMVGLFVSESYDSLGAAPEIKTPSLVIHGTRDEIIPVEHGRRIAAALPQSRWVEVEGAGHNDLLGRRQVWDELASFLSGF